METLEQATSKTIFLKPRRSNGGIQYHRSVDFLVTNPPLVGIVEHFIGALDGFSDEGAYPRVIAVFPPTEEGITRAYETLEEIKRKVF